MLKKSDSIYEKKFQEMFKVSTFRPLQSMVRAVKRLMVRINCWLTRGRVHRTAGQKFTKSAAKISVAQFAYSLSFGENLHKMSHPGNITLFLPSKNKTQKLFCGKRLISIFGKIFWNIWGLFRMVWLLWEFLNIFVIDILTEFSFFFGMLTNSTNSLSETIYGGK